MGRGEGLGRDGLNRHTQAVPSLDIEDGGYPLGSRFYGIGDAMDISSRFPGRGLEDCSPRREQAAWKARYPEHVNKVDHIYFRRSSSRQRSSRER
jgi:hypothetical protein